VPLRQIFNALRPALLNALLFQIYNALRPALLNVLLCQMYNTLLTALLRQRYIKKKRGYFRETPSPYHAGNVNLDPAVSR
jgi:hypothetical protein